MANPCTPKKEHVNFSYIQKLIFGTNKITNIECIIY